jgi:hypothetical protein
MVSFRQAEWNKEPQRRATAVRLLGAGKDQHDDGPSLMKRSCTRVMPLRLPTPSLRRLP